MPRAKGDAPKTPEDASELPFEEALERLETIVSQLEDGDLELETALQAFEEGVGLTRHCSARLEAAERRIEVLVGEGERLSTRPFEGTDDGEAG